MNSLRKVLSNTGVSFIGQIVTWVSALALTAAYGRFLGGEKFGELFFAISFVALVGFPIEFGFNQQIVRDVAQDPSKALRYPANVLLLKLGLWAILFAAILGVSNVLGFAREERLLVALCGCVLLVSATGSTFGSIHTAAQRQVFPAIGLVIDKGLGAIIAIVWMRAGGGVVAAGAALLIGSCAGALWQIFWFVRLVGIRWGIDFRLIRNLVMQSIPFLTYGVIGVIYYRIDAVFLQSFTTTTTVGMYGAAYRLFDTLVFLPNIVVVAVMYPVMAKLSVNSERQMKLAIEKSVNFLLVAGIPIMVGLITAAPNIIGFLYHNPQFDASIPVLQALAPGLAILYLNTVWTTALMSLKLERHLPKIAGAALVFNVIGNVLLIPRLGGVGAAIVTSLTELLLMVLALAVLPRNMLPVRSIATGAKALGASLAMALVVVAMSKLPILVILPVGILVYALVATVLATIPREDLDALYMAVARRSRGAAPAVNTPVASRQGGSSTALALSGNSYTSSAEWHIERGRVQSVDTNRLPRWLQNLASAVSQWGTNLASGIGSAVRAMASRIRQIAASCIKYATNYIIAYVPSHSIRHGWYRWILGWDVGHGVAILMGPYIQMTGIRTSGRRVSIGNGTVINQKCLIYTSGGLIIGSNVSISAEVALITGTHDINDPGFPSDYRPIVIDDYAWIGTRAMILQGVTIGQGAVVMAGSVVTKDVEPFAVVGGVPAKPITERTLRNPSYHLMEPPLFE